MKHWTSLLLLIGLIVLAIHNLSPVIERDVHNRVVMALADEDLSEIRVQVDGRTVLLSGPGELLSQAEKLVKEIPETGHITTLEAGYQILDNSAFERTYTQVLHPEGIYWPLRSTPSSSSEAELLITKVHQSVEVNGSVPNQNIHEAILSKIALLVDMPTHLFDVTINKVNKTPAWYNAGLPLMIPFVQWVEEGQIQYLDNKIMIDGTVISRKASKALESAIADLPSKFQIENKLRLGTGEY